MAVFRKLLKNRKGDIIIPVVDKLRWVPDYSKASSTNLWSSSTSTTITESGFVTTRVCYYKINANCELYIYINGLEVSYCAGEARGPNNAVVSSVSGVFPVSVGDIVSYGYTSGASANSKMCKFIPGKWA